MSYTEAEVSAANSAMEKYRGGEKGEAIIKRWEQYLSSTGLFASIQTK